MVSEATRDGVRRFWASMTVAERHAFAMQRGRALRTHGASGHPLYHVWRAMISRCHNPKHPRFSSWGGRGIVVCLEWRTDPWVFIRWAEAHGYAQGLEIDRRDNENGYSPDNCRFVTEKVQASNRRPRVLTEVGKAAIRAAVIASNKRRRRA